MYDYCSDSQPGSSILTVGKLNLQKFAYSPAKSKKEDEIKSLASNHQQNLQQKLEAGAALPVLLAPDLLLVFVGFNPGLESARLGHYYAHRSNRFWKFIYQCGLVNRPVTCTDDSRLQKEYRYGFTDLVGRSTKGITELSRIEMAAGAELLEKRIAKYKPRLVCLVGKGIFEAIAKTKSWSLKSFQYGLQPQLFGSARLFVVPSTSGLVSMPATKMLEYWGALSNLIRDERTRPPVEKVLL